MVSDNVVAAVLVAILIVAIVLMFWILIVFARRKSVKFPEVKNSTINLPTVDSNTIRNYQCKSSYNSCASGDFVNSWVDLKALVFVLQSGCRFVDFEIHDIEGEPVVAVSNTKQLTVKGSFNSLPLASVFATINSEGFKTKLPLFVQFRIQCEHTNVINKIARLLQQYFAAKLLGSEYQYNLNSQVKFSEAKLKDLYGKIVIVVDLSNKYIVGSALKEYLNLGGGTASNRIYRFHQLSDSPPTDLDLFAKQNLVTCLPNVMSSAANYDSNKIMALGVQFPAMCYQKQDSLLNEYNAKFDGYSFILKPETMRYYATPIPAAKPLGADVNYSNIGEIIRAGGEGVDVNLPGNSA